MFFLVDHTVSKKGKKGLPEAIGAAHIRVVLIQDRYEFLL
jgi:hypothetical protein